VKGDTVRTGLAVGGVAACVLAFAISARAAAPEVWCGRLRFLPAEKPALYLSINSVGQLRIADSAAGLRTAKPVMAREDSRREGRQNEPTYYLVFPEVKLPVSLPGVEEMKATVSLYRTHHRRTRRSPAIDEVQIPIDFALTKRDSKGTKYTYLFFAGVPTIKGKSKGPEESGIVQVPAMESLHVMVVTRVEGRKAGIALQATAGRSSVENVLKGGKGAPCRVEVLDKDGKVLHSARGDLKKFGFT